MTIQRSVALISIMFLCAVQAFGESSVKLDVLVLGGLTKGVAPADDPATDEDESETTDWHFIGSGTGLISFRSVGNSNVKGQIDVQAVIGETSTIDITKAWVKVRFPYLRLTLGKIRASWGEGFTFNAGDVIYDSTSLNVNMSSDSFREESSWQIGLYVPIGSFNFFEVILFPPNIDTIAAVMDPAYTIPTIREIAAGGRFSFEAGSTKIQTGYIYKGADDLHNAYHSPYLSFQGNLELDWYIAASVKFPHRLEEDNALESWEDWGERVYDSIDISTGLFWQYNITRDITIMLRLETLSNPMGEWKPVPEGLTAINQETGEVIVKEYGMYIYPEISLTPNDQVSLTLRGMYSPVDSSAAISLMASWNVFQGLSLLAFGQIQAGESGTPEQINSGEKNMDVFGWDRYGDTVISIGARYIF